MGSTGPYRPPPQIVETIDFISEQLSERNTGESERRRAKRSELRISCEVYFFVRSSSDTGSLPGQTRNISRNGVGVLVRRSFHENEPIEVRIVPSGRPALHMAGLVRFCRYISDGFFEVGVELKHASAQPIFGDDAVEGIHLDWVVEAMERKSKNAFSIQRR